MKKFLWIGFDDDDLEYQSLGNVKHDRDSSNPLSQIINLQLANGAWELTSELSNMVGKSITDLKDACPVSCNGNMMTIWATCIVLAYLDIHLSTVKDEWELVGMKAKSWLMMQVLPQGYSYEDLLEKANQILKSQPPAISVNAKTTIKNETPRNSKRASCKVL
ncbi:von Willebrand factor A domain-containing protein 5A-like [Xenia sp. Carnegie-2017]|uniref:von Willebrand factor A domain-containing protein 5A-like n=1 Tax=Xenia sp. Carnegie-2017 TaxID=2897299 RepID=UPI001F042FE2|nr:von Willebrand factor A domain-containing protein 5A-like [Xenia sp. Carnegie-2017]